MRDPRRARPRDRGGASCRHRPRPARSVGRARRRERSAAHRAHRPRDAADEPPVDRAVSRARARDRRCRRATSTRSARCSSCSPTTAARSPKACAASSPKRWARTPTRGRAHPRSCAGSSAPSTLVARTTLREIEVAAARRGPGLGLRLGRFELAKQLGAGAMGEVWEARDTTGGPNVAIKLLRPEVAADEELLRRFRKEGRVLAKVGSPYIANFVDLNEDKGLHYLVLELVAGGSVAAALRRLGKLPERLALGDRRRYLPRARRAAPPRHRPSRHQARQHDVRARGHRARERRRSGQLVKLGDFGIARLHRGRTTARGRDARGRGARHAGVHGARAVPGRAGHAATDVYALGCCLFALIAGRPPFVTVDDNQMAVILQHLARAAAAPRRARARGHADGRRSRREVPREGSAGSARRTPTEVLAAIEQLCDGTAALITAHPAPRRSCARARCRPTRSSGSCRARPTRCGRSSRTPRR